MRRLAIFLFALLLPVLVIVAPAHASVLARPPYVQAEADFLHLINQYRASQGLGPVQVDDTISIGAYLDAKDMETYQWFSHDTVQSDYFPAGATPWDRMTAVGYGYNTNKGENIAAGQATAQSVFDAWKASPGHNANMLGSTYTVMGIGLYVGPNAYRYYWVTDFGSYADPSAHPDITVMPPDQPFADIDKSDPELWSSCWYVKDAKLMQGYLNGDFGPWDSLSRNQVALVMQRDGRTAPASWIGDYSVASRGEVMQAFPGLTWLNPSDTVDPVLRSQLARLVYRAAGSPPAVVSDGGGATFPAPTPVPPSTTTTTGPAPTTTTTAPATTTSTAPPSTTTTTAPATTTTEPPTTVTTAAVASPLSDEFTASGLDGSRWRYGFPWTGKSGNANADELQKYVPENVIQSGDGYLHLQAERRLVDGMAYASGAVSSLGTFTFGRVDVRARVPQGQGLWPAAWMLSLGNWPPEVDIFEFVNYFSGAYMTLWWGTSASPHQAEGQYWGLDGGFHTYTLDWRSDHVAWSIDGVERFRQTANVPQVPMYLLLNLAVGGSWAGPPDATTPFPASMDIDYVRVSP